MFFLFSQNGCRVIVVIFEDITTTNLWKWVIHSEEAGPELPPMGGGVREYLFDFNQARPVKRKTH